MELTARFLYAISIFLFAFGYFDINLEDSLGREVIIQSGHSGRRYLHGKAWRKVNLSKSAHKRSRRKAAFSAGLDCMDPFFDLLFCGDVELNPGPANQKNTKIVKNDKYTDFSEILIRLEKKIERGQESILENQNRMLARLTTIEEEIDKFKVDIADVKSKHSDLESKVNAMSNDISLNYDHGRDLQFLIDRQEQYSRKNSICIRGVREEMGEDIEKVTLGTLKKELDLDMERSEIDIVHRVGPCDDNKPRSTLVKFLCHKSKENVMRHKKMRRT